MARRVFLSMLGAGYYGIGKYTDISNGFESSPTRYIQHAILQYIEARNWTQNDVVIIALTEYASKCNWIVEGNKRKRRDNDDYEDYIGLKCELEQLNLEASIKELMIPEGKNENEMWNIFSLIFDSLEQGDELYIDLTHSFRYLPMLLLVLADYARLIKDVKVKGMTYGNWDARDEQTNCAPIVDLMPLIALQNWSTATHEITCDGNAKSVKEAAKESLKDLLRSNDCRNDIKALSNATKSLASFVEQIRTCRGKNILSGKDFSIFLNKLEDTSKDSFPPLVPILDKIKQSFLDSGFKSEYAIYNLYAASKWCAHMNLGQSAITLLLEGLITKVCILSNLNYEVLNDRECVMATLKVTLDDIPKENWGFDFDRQVKVEKILALDFFSDKKFSRLLKSVSGIRNDFNHSGMRDNSTDENKVVRIIKEKIEESKAYFELADPVRHINPEPVFINLSNHPSTKWSSEQFEAAMQYGEIEDVTFPVIDPNADDESLDELALQYFNKILNLSEGKNPTIHVMGEMTFTYRIVAKLKEYGIKCVASTTERITKDNEDGTKTSLFRFVKFRRS